MSERRPPAPVSSPVVLAVAGSDAGGGAGIQADVAAVAAHDGFPTTAITAVTAQNTRGVESVHVLPAEEVQAQIDAVVEDFDVAAVKTGMLADRANVEVTTESAAAIDAPIVVDPVMVAASGDRLLDRAAEQVYVSLIGEATLVTPNLDEVEVLTDIAVDSTADAEQAGRALRSLGTDAALIKGGHRDGDRIEDVLVTSDDTTTFTHPRIETEATHGSGCVLSSTIATELATGSPVTEAVEAATAFMERAVRYHFDVGTGPGAVNPRAVQSERSARGPTAEAVHDIVDHLLDRNARVLVPEVGMNVAGATPLAERPTEVAAVEGRITRTVDGLAPNRGVRFGASSHVARFLLACREHDPALQFAVNCRYNEEIIRAAEHLAGPVPSYDRSDQPPEVAEQEGSTMAWGARQAFDAVEETPAAVADPGAVGKEPILKLLGTSPAEVCDAIDTLLDHRSGDRTD